MRTALNVLTALLLAITAMLAAPLAAHAADTHAPAGARADWLPNSEWVMSSWLPYDESRLDALLGTSREELSHWLDDRRTIGELARKRGRRSLHALASSLVIKPRGRQRAILVRRALATLTQAHLARHVLFHIFHTPAIASASILLFGITPARFRALRAGGASPSRIATTNGRTDAQLLARLDSLFVSRAARAVATGSSPAEQAARVLQLQRAGAAAFTQHAYRTPAQQVLFACSLHVY